MFTTDGRGVPSSWSITHSIALMICSRWLPPEQPKTRTPTRRDVLRHAVLLAADRPGHVGAVTVAVGGVVVMVGEVTAGDRATLEVVVRHVDAGVDDVDPHAFAGAVVEVPAVQRQVALIDPVESPGRLCRAIGRGPAVVPPGVDQSVGLDVVHRGIRPHRSRAAGGRLAAKPRKTVAYL